MEICSTSGVKLSSTFIIFLLTVAYRSKSPDRKTSSGQSLRARVDGVAEKTP